MHHGDDNDHQWYRKAGVEERDSILYSPDSRGCSKSLRCLPSKLRPLDTDKDLWSFFIITVDGLAAIQLESLHSATLRRAIVSWYRAPSRNSSQSTRELKR